MDFRKYLDEEKFESVLTVGAGTLGLRHGFLSNLWNCPVRVGIEAVADKCKTWDGSGWVILNQEIPQRLPFIDNYFDVVLAIDIIEHLPPVDGHILIEELERICRKMLLIFTPSGYVDTAKYQKEYVKTCYDLHNSGWEPIFFEKRGYEVEILEKLHNFGTISFDAFFAWKGFDIDG